MAVYTDITGEDLEVFLADYGLELLAFKGIAEGVENSNFLVHTEADGQQTDYILTLYEKRTRAEDLPFFLGLMEHLSGKGYSCPMPVKDRLGDDLKTLSDRPAAMVTFLQGFGPKRASPQQCEAVGEVMAEMHLASDGFALTRENGLALESWRPLLEDSADRADEVRPGLLEEMRGEIAYLEAHWPRDLPRGVIHADLFPDNVFFLGGRVSGVIDFYFACNDQLAYDLAVCLNCWCFEDAPFSAEFNITKARALLRGYNRVRPLEDRELAALPLLARGAAMRFFVTRLYDWLNTPQDALVKRKDPLEYVRKLNFHRDVSDVSAYGLTD